MVSEYQMGEGPWNVDKYIGDWLIRKGVDEH